VPDLRPWFNLVWSMIPHCKQDMHEFLITQREDDAKVSSERLAKRVTIVTRRIRVRVHKGQWSMVTSISNSDNTGMETSETEFVANETSADSWKLEVNKVIALVNPRELADEAMLEE
jgi:hypothetical protein